MNLAYSETKSETEMECSTVTRSCGLKVEIVSGTHRLTERDKMRSNKGLCATPALANAYMSIARSVLVQCCNETAPKGLQFGLGESEIDCCKKIESFEC